MLHCAQGFELDASVAEHLSPLLQRLKRLILERCTIAPGSLGGLAACTQLESLSPVDTVLEQGAGEALAAALQHLPSLELELWRVEEAGLPQGRPPFRFLASLAPCLTSLTVNCCTNKDVLRLLELASQHMWRLQHLTLHSSLVAAPDRCISALAAGCQQLRSLQLEALRLPSLPALAALMAMPQLQQLSIDCLPEDDGSSPVSSVPIAWPPGKHAES